MIKYFEAVNSKNVISIKKKPHHTPNQKQDP